MNKYTKFILAGLMIIGLLMLSGLSSALGSGLAAIGTPTPTPTRTVTPTPNLVSRLIRQLSFSPGGGLSRNSAFNCRNDGYPEDSPPEIWFHGRADYDIQEGALCMINFPMDGPFTIEMTAPDGTRYSQEMIPGSDSDNGYFGFDYEDDGGGFTYGMMRLWLSPDVQSGEWQVEYFTQDDYHTYTVDIDWPKKSPNLYVPRDDPNPFELPQDFFTLGAAHLYQIANLDPGQSVKLSGYNMPARQEVPIGLYQVTQVQDKDEQLRLVQAITARSNGNGAISFDFKPNKSLPPGGYYLGAITNLKANNVYSSGGGLGVYVDACPGALASRLLLGDKVRINPDFTDNNKIYNQPGLGNQKVGQLGQTLTADVKEGPACANEQVWWKVRTSKGVEGWISEAADFVNYLVRVNK